MSAARGLVLFCMVSASAFAQSDNLGAFANSGDVGGPAKKGSVEFNAASGQYRITGGGVNMWTKQDQFQYVWREMTGNFTVTATMEFLGKGEDHRKGGIVVRQTLDTDSAYGDIVIHGNGMPGLQWRSNKGEDTNSFDMPFDGPGKYKLTLVRAGVGLTATISKVGTDQKNVVRTEVTFRGPILVGLAVCAHNADNLETVVFSDVSVDATVPPGSH
jgi:TolB protein